MDEEDEIRIVNWSAIAMIIVVLAAILLFLAGVVVVMYYAVVWLGLQAAIAWAALVGLILLVVRADVRRRQAEQRLLADRKREQYFELLEVLRKAFYSDDPFQSMRRQRQELHKWSLRLSLIASDEVLNAWHSFCHAALYGPDYDEDEEDEDHDEDQDEDEQDEDQDDEDRLFAAQVRLVQALRRDCGHAHTRIMRWQLGEILDLD